MADCGRCLRGSTDYISTVYGTGPSQADGRVVCLSKTEPVGGTDAVTAVGRVQDSAADSDAVSVARIDCGIEVKLAWTCACGRVDVGPCGSVETSAADV